jgi:hypothetical protein
MIMDLPMSTEKKQELMFPVAAVSKLLLCFAGKYHMAGLYLNASLHAFLTLPGEFKLRGSL